MLRHAEATRTPVDWTFYCTVEGPGALEPLARDLGAAVIRSTVPLGQKADFLLTLRAELKRGGYEVLHGHHDLLNSLYFLASLGTSVTRRIAHVHNADLAIPTRSPLKSALYREPMRRVCLALADAVVGISQHTLDTFLRGRARRPGRDIVHYYGVDPTPFARVSGERDKFRHAHGIPRDAAVLLFAGRMVPEKNPVFAVDVLHALQRHIPDVVGVFAGAGPEEGNVIFRSRQLGIEKSVRLAGWRSDLPAVMGSADLFILPHPDRPLEGFGLAVVEAQLAGLRMLLSNGVADDPLLPTAVFRRLPLSAGAARWADSAAELLRLEPALPESAQESLKGSSMDMDYALEDLLNIHEA